MIGSSYGLVIQAASHRRVLEQNLAGAVHDLAQATISVDHNQYSAALTRIQAAMSSLGFALSAVSALRAIEDARELLLPEVES